MSVYRRPLLQAWEAAYTAELTLDQLRRRAATVGAALAGQRARCLIAFDTRFLANLLAQTLAHDLAAQGVSVMLAGAPAPLPAIHHALDRKQADCALYVSARNRPYYMGGLILIADEKSGLSIDPSPDPLPSPEFPPPSPPQETVDLRAPYLDALRSVIDLDAIRRLPMTFFIDAMAGTTAGMATALLGEGGQTRAIEINRDPDPLFARGAPQPFEAKVLTGCANWCARAICTLGWRCLAMALRWRWLIQPGRCLIRLKSVCCSAAIWRHTIASAAWCSRRRRRQMARYALIQNT